MNTKDKCWFLRRLITKWKTITAVLASLSISLLLYRSVSMERFTDASLRLVSSFSSSFSSSSSSSSSSSASVFRLFDLSSVGEESDIRRITGNEVLRMIRADYPTTVAVSNTICTLSKRGEPNDTEAVESSDLIVPNVVHYTFMGSDLNFTFLNYLSYLSVERFIQPDAIFVHGDTVPAGKWWNTTVRMVRNIYHVPRPYSNTSSNGVLMKFPAHVTDYARAEILIRYGGIYLDADVLSLKSFAPLRKFPMTIGRETKDGLCNGIMIARRGALFVRLILEQYRSYEGEAESWAGKSVFNIHTLARLYPHLVHVEESSLNKPNWMEVQQLYEGFRDTSRNYAVHLWVRRWPKQWLPSGPTDLKKSATVGRIYSMIMVKKSNNCL